MSDQVEGVVAAICQLPLSFKARTDLSLRFQASGYAAWAPEVTEDAIRAYLEQRPELIDAWLGYSQDQRCTPAWYLERVRSGSRAEEQWVVGYYEGGRTLEEKFQDGCAACARFIKRFSDSLWG